jgi:hypothetical protein
MGQDAAATVKEIEDTRARLEGNLLELQQRLPGPAVWAKRTAAFAAAGGAGATTLAAIVKRRQSKRRAAELKRVQALIDALPKEWTSGIAKSSSKGRGGKLATGVAVACLVLLGVAVAQIQRKRKARSEETLGIPPTGGPPA